MAFKDKHLFIAHRSMDWLCWLCSTVDQVQFCSTCLSIWVLDRRSTWGMLFSWKRNTTIEAHIILLLRHGFLTVFRHDIFLHLISQSKPWGQARQQWGMRYTCSFHRGEGKQEYLLKMIQSIKTYLSCFTQKIISLLLLMI